MKVIRIISLAVAAAGLMALSACKTNKNSVGYPTSPAVAPGSYIDSGK